MRFIFLKNMKLNLRGLPPDQGMNTERRMIARSVQDREVGHNPVLKAVLIYENFATGVRARGFCERLVRALDHTLEEQMWSFDVLGIREARNAAARAAIKADVVIVSVLGHTDLPSTIRAWLDMWVWLLDKENPALVALFGSSTPPNTASIHAYLSAIARSAGIEFFTYKITPPVYPQNVGSRYLPGSPNCALAAACTHWTPVHRKRSAA